MTSLHSSGPIIVQTLENLTHMTNTNVNSASGAAEPTQQRWDCHDKELCEREAHTQTHFCRGQQMSTT